MKKKQLFLIGIFFVACNLSDVADDLPGGWMYISEGKTYKYIFKNNKKNRNIIFPDVVKFVSNDDYILAYQQPNKELSTQFIAFDIDIEQTATSTAMERYEESFRMADSVLENNEYYKRIISSTSNYWIIDIKQDTVYGPLKKKEYLRIKKKKNIPLEL